MNQRMLLRAGWSVALLAAALAPSNLPAKLFQTKAAVTTDTLAPAGTDLLRETGRRLTQELEPAIVTVRVVVNQQVSMGGQNNEKEMKIESSGTVIAPDGLTIVPLSAVDPSQLFERYARGDINVSSRVKDIRFLLNKRDEVPASVVLRDNDLNIAFLRPKTKPATPWKFVNLKDSVEPRLLDPVFVLARMGRVADREMGAMTGEIQSIINRPRRFYVPSSELATGGLGVPIFSATGKVIGIVLVRSTPGGSDTMTMGSGDSNMLVVILPAKDVQEVADQAPEKAAEEPAAQEPAKPAPDKGAPEATPTQPGDKQPLNENEPATGSQS